MKLSEKPGLHLLQLSEIFWANAKIKIMLNEMLSSFKSLGCNMSIKGHYFYSHLDRFPENLGDTSEEQGERFH